MYILSWKRQIKFLVMNKVSDVLPERFNQDPLESYFCKQYPPGVWKDKLPLYGLVYSNTFQNQKVFKPIATGIVRDENINFELDRTSSTSEKIQTKQFLLSSKVSTSHQIPSYQTYTTSKSNEYINELTLRYFGLFCQTFHIPFDQLFFVVMKNFFNRYIKRLLKSRNYWFLIYRILHYFPMFSKNSIS